MAARTERDSVRVRVQVVATLLPLNIPVHVDSFWTLVKFSETPHVCDIEKKLIFFLNSMSKECHLELVVHDSPITPNWTYVPATRSSFQSSIALHQQNRSKNFPDVVSQQLTILVKPHSCKYMSGTKKKMKPQSPVLMAYDISRILPRSTRLVFKKQLMFMHDSVLLSSSVSEILRDDDVVIISAT